MTTLAVVLLIGLGAYAALITRTLRRLRRPRERGLTISEAIERERISG
jgi:hypothetical protein